MPELKNNIALLSGSLRIFSCGDERLRCGAEQIRKVSSPTGKKLVFFPPQLKRPKYRVLACVLLSISKNGHVAVFPLGYLTAIVDPTSMLAVPRTVMALELRPATSRYGPL